MCSNRDILIGSIAAAIGMSITFLARFALFFGGGDDNRGGGFGLLAAWILAPIAAAIIQMAVSRSREYQADESGAYLSQRSRCARQRACASSRSRPSRCRRCGR